jgi:hypothetical protein
METTDIILAILPYAGTAVAGVVGKIIFDWLKGGRRKRSASETATPAIVQSAVEDLCVKLEDIEDDVKWLRERHDKTDENGLPMWYVPRDLTRFLIASRERDGQQIELLNHIVSELKEHRNLLWDLLKG